MSDVDEFQVYDDELAAEIVEIVEVKPKSKPRRTKRRRPEELLAEYERACAARIEASKALDRTVSAWHITNDAHEKAKRDLAAAEGTMAQAVDAARAASLAYERVQARSRK